jgi:hypothetical protein
VYCSTRIGPAIAIIAGSTLMTEIMLTRLFSVVFWNHLAFLAISVALFGFAASALAVHFAHSRLASHCTESLLCKATSALAVAIIACDLIILAIPTTGDGALSFFSLITVFLAAACPFFASGFAICLAMTRLPDRATSLYFWDLAGSATGCLAVVPLLSLWGAPSALAIVSLVALCTTPLLVSRSAAGLNALKLPGAIAAIVLVLLASQNPTGALRVHFAKGVDVAKLGVEFNRWNSFSMVTVFPQPHFKGWSLSKAWNGPIPEHKSLVIDMNAMTALMRWQGNPNDAQFSLYDATSFVHHVRAKSTNVCVVGAGAGKDVLAALAASASSVTGVEINPLIVNDVMRDKFHDFVGNLYSRPDVSIQVEDGRHFLSTTKKSFDVIQLSMVDTSAATAAGAYALTENSVYTVEAFEEFYDRLSDDGMLSVSSVSLNNLAVGERLTWVAREALSRKGQNPATQMMVLTTPWLGLPNAVLHNVILCHSAFTEDQLSRAKSEAERLGFFLAYAPNQKLGASSKSAIIESIITKPKNELLAAAEKLPLDLRPTTDDRPFFFYQNRLSDLVRLLAADRPDHMFGNGGYFLGRLLAVSLLIAGIFVGLPLLFARRLLQAGKGRPVLDALYFVCLGVGFMAAEIAVIQNLMVFLGKPTYALIAVLFVLLATGGIGSAFAGKLNNSPLHRAAPPTFVALYILAFWVSPLASSALRAAIAWPDTARLALAAAFLAPLGFALGMPLPLAIKALAQRAPSRIPWLWGINGTASVLGSLFATVLSIHAGISNTMASAAALYALAALLSLSVCKRVQNA